MAKKSKFDMMLSADEARAFFGAIPRPDKRKMAMMSLLLFNGLRASEVVHLEVGDVDLNSEWINIVGSKGVRTEEYRRLKNMKSLTIPEKWRLHELRRNSGKTRSIPILNEALPYLREYMRTLPQDSKLVFPGRYGAPMTVKNIESMVKIVGANAGINRVVLPHMLRHTCGSLLAEQGWDMVKIADFLGHEDLRTTRIYVNSSRESLQRAAQTVKLL